MKFGKTWTHTGMCSQQIEMFFYHDVIEKRTDYNRQ